MGWYMYDLAQPIVGVAMIEEAGSPIDFKPVHSVDLQRYIGWIVEAYESARGTKVDMDHLMRMLELRRQFYFTFCRKASAELKDNTQPEMEHMRKFIEFVLDWEKKRTAT